MDLRDIHYVPLTGGKNNSGRQRVLGFTIWRRSDFKFLDAKNGVWSDQAVINPLRELGRNHKGEADVKTRALRGVYVPEFPVELGQEPLDGHYTMLVNDREQDHMVIAEHPLHYCATPAPAARSKYESTLLAGCGVLVGLLLLAGLARR